MTDDQRIHLVALGLLLCGIAQGMTLTLVAILRAKVRQLEERGEQ